MNLEIISEHPREKIHATPLLVLSAENDRVFTVTEQQKPPELTTRKRRPIHTWPTI